MIMSDKKELKIEDIDKNLKVPTTTGKNDIAFYNVRRAPFEIYGLHSPETEGDFLRMPAEVAEAVSANLASLNKNTAGGRVRFSTDSKYIAIKCVMPAPRHMPHMAFSGSTGFDLYRDTDSGSYFVGSFIPPVTFNGGEFETIIELSGVGEMRNYTINFPTYSGFTPAPLDLTEKG